MNIFEKMYVGFQRDRYRTNENPRILGFAVPYDQTKASKNRQKTVDNWRQKDIEPRILENSPTRGFRLLEVVSRYSTSNKLFRVLDPRGFELEISSDNLLDIALASTIVKGEIVEECVWASSNGVYLLPTSDARYALHKKSSKEGPTKITEGGYYTSVGNMISVFRFEGIHQHTYLDIEHKAIKGKLIVDPTYSTYWSSKRYKVEIDEYESNVKIKMNTGGKPVYIYTEFYTDGEGMIKSKQIHIRKSHFKNLVPFEDATQEMKDFVPNILAHMKWDGYYATKPEGTSIITNIGGSYDGYFKTKEEARKFDYSDIIKTVKAKNTKGYRYSSNMDLSCITSDNDRYVDIQIDDRTVHIINTEDLR